MNIKKSLIILTVLGTFVFTSSHATSVTEGKQIFTTINYLIQDQIKEISFRQLPEDVQISFEESQFALWEVKKVVMNAYNQEPDKTTYEVTVSNEEEEMRVLFDQEGNIVG